MDILEASTKEFKHFSISELLSHTIEDSELRDLVTRVFSTSYFNAKTITDDKPSDGDYVIERLHYPYARIASIGNESLSGSNVALSIFINEYIKPMWNINFDMKIQPVNIKFYEVKSDNGQYKYADASNRTLIITGYLYPVNRTYIKERIGTFRIVFYEVSHSMNYNQKLNVPRGVFEYIVDEDLLNPMKRINEVTQSITLSIGHLTKLVELMCRMIVDWDENKLDELLNKPLYADWVPVYNNVSEKLR